MTGLFDSEAFEQMPGQMSMEAVEPTFASRVVRVEGERHIREDGRECSCGCQWVDGLPGTVIEECGDTVVAEFWTDYHGYVKVAYDVR